MRTAVAVLFAALLPLVAAAPPDNNKAFDLLLNLMIVLMMLGMASTVDKDQARAAFSKWKAPLLGIFSQCFFMPFCAYLLGIIFDLPPVSRVGLILVGCTPGGTTSQLFTYWSKGNVALSFLMTVASTTLSLAWIPAMIKVVVDPYIGDFDKENDAICVKLLTGEPYYSPTGGVVFAASADVATVASDKPDNWNANLQMPKYCWDTQLTGDEWKCAQQFYDCAGNVVPNKTAIVADQNCYHNKKNVCGGHVTTDFKAVVTLLLVIIVAASIGYFSREPCFGNSALSKWHGLRNQCIKNVAPWLTCIGSSMGMLAVVVLIVWGSIDLAWIYDEATYKTWLCCIFIGMLGFLFGYFIARAFGFSIRDARTISLETGIQNGPLAITIVSAALPACSSMTPFNMCAQKQAMLFPYLYSVFIVIQSVIVTNFIYGRQRPEPLPLIPAEKSKSVGDAADGATRCSNFGDQSSNADLGDLTLPDLANTIYDARGSAPKTTMRNLYDTFQRGVKLHANRPCLGTRTKTGAYSWLTYAEVDAMANAFGAGLKNACGVKPGDFVAIMSTNRVEWVVTAEACHAHGFIKVPLYDTLGDEAIEHIINQTQLKVVVCQPSCQRTLIELKGACPSLEHVIVLPQTAISGTAGGSKVVGVSDLESYITEGESAAANANGGAAVKSTSFTSIVQNGTDNPSAPTPTEDPDDLCMLCYTSGTTGQPKGAMLSHRNVVANIASNLTMDTALMREGQKPIFFTGDDVHISYLPLAHIFEQLVISSLFVVGARAGFYSGSIPQLMDDIKELRPTIFVSVPRLLNRLHDKVMARMEAQTGWVGDTCATLWPPPKLVKWMFDKGYAAKQKELPLPSVESGFWDSSVFGSIAQNILGGRVRMILTGAAPIPAHVLDFLRICFSCNVIEGYGQTESAAAITIGYPHDTATGNCGVPVPANQVKLVDVPEMDYTTADQPCPRGEVCCKGPNVFKGYYKDEEKTREAIDADGWLHTGDIGQWNQDGTLKIIDRKKNIFKLAQGEYVAPEKLEAVAQSSPYIAQAFIYGDSLQAYLVSVVVPDHEVLKTWAKDNGLAVGSGPGVDADGNVAEWYGALCALPKVKELVMKELTDTAKAANHKGFEKPKETFIEAQPFDADRGLLTPTFKPKRPQLRKHYQDKIDAMYAALNK